MSDKLTDSVMEQIEQKRVAMRPRWQFVLSTVVGVAGSVLTSLVVVYLVNVLTLAYRVHMGSTPMYGARNRIDDLVTNFPWETLALAVVCFAILIWLLRKSSRLYRVRTAWVVAAVLLVSVVVGIAFAYSSYGSVGHQQNMQQMHTPGRGMHRNMQ